MEKNDILKVLDGLTLPGQGQSISKSGAITNINIFGQEVVIDLTLKIPALHVKKRVITDITEALEKKFGSDLKTQINITVPPMPKKGTQLIKGRPIAGINNIVAIASGKGGVGKSTVTAGLAVKLAEMGFSVGVLDADVYGPSIPIMFDIAGARPLSIQVEGKSKMAPIVQYGVKILSIGFFTQPNQAVIWRGPMAAKALNQMIFDAAWGELDFLLIDLPPGTGDIHLSIMQSLPITGAVVVSTPQNVALADAKKGVAMFAQENIQVPVLGIVENMAYFTPSELPDNKYYIFGQSGARHLAKDLEIEFLGEIPLVQSIRQSGDVGRPAAMQSGTPVAEAFELITREVVRQTVRRNKDLPPTEAVKITTMAGCSAIKSES